MAPVGTSTKGIVPVNADFDFNLGATKAKVMKQLDESMPTLFRKFYNSQHFDRLLQTCLLYFTVLFQHEWVVTTMDKSRKQHIEGYNPYAVAQRIRELTTELASLRLELSPLYSMIILKFSSYEKPQQDRKFFEALYESLICIVDDAFERLKKRPDIEREMGLLFRSKHFNMYTRKHQPPRSVDTLSVKELYALKNETHNRALNARMLASLFEKPQTLGVTVASVTNSPLVSQYIMSPIVARAMMKDPEQRNTIFKPKAGDRAAGSETGHQEKRKNIGNVFRSTAMLHGVNPEKLAADMSTGKMKMDNTSDIGVMSAERARRGDSSRPGTTVPPEAVGLPVDDAFTYLTLMKRYVMYGPSLGLNTAGPSTAQNGGVASTLTDRTGSLIPPTPSGGGGGALAGLLKSVTAGGAA